MMQFNRIVRLAASPCFLLLALTLYSDSDMALQICGLVRSEKTIPLFGRALEVPLASLGSMWVMYLVMAVFHSGPWIALLSTGALGEDCCEPQGRIR